MSNAPLMPKATAVWLVDNTSLTFDQIADFCHLHVLEIKGIADGDVAQGIKGMDPISSSQLTRDEIDKAQKNSIHRLKMAPSKVKIPTIERKKSARYTPVSRRQDRPNAILWLVRNHEELNNSQIIRLVGTTKPTIDAIRSGTHHRSGTLQPIDPVASALCTQVALDKEVMAAALRVARKNKREGIEVEEIVTLVPAAETIADQVDKFAENLKNIGTQGEKEQEKVASVEDVFGQSPAPAAAKKKEKAPDASNVFAKLKKLKTSE